MTWTKKENELIKSLFTETSNFEELSVKMKLQGFHRSPLAIGFKLVNLGIIKKEVLDEWMKVQEEIRVKQRYENSPTTKKEVYERDKGKCIYCNKSDELIYAHIIPFRLTKQNLSKETILLCSNHHKQFDKGDKEIIEKVFSKMCEYYLDYPNKYWIKQGFCETCNRSHTKIERVGQNPTQIHIGEEGATQG